MHIQRNNCENPNVTHPNLNEPNANLNFGRNANSFVCICKQLCLPVLLFVRKRIVTVFRDYLVKYAFESIPNGIYAKIS